MTWACVLMAVMAAVSLYVIGYAHGKDHGKWLATPSPAVAVSVPTEVVEAAVNHDLWLAAKNPYCSVGETNLVHEVMGACPCV